MNYNIIQEGNIFKSIAVIFSLCSLNAQSQVLETSKYGVQFIQNPASYQISVENDSLKKMTDVQSGIIGVVLDLRYATRHNFTGQRLYPKKTRHTYLRLAAVRQLMKVQDDLNRMGLGLKIFDAYRPYSVTEKFWELIHDPRYVADPSKGSGHNRGIAVDLTIIDLRSGKELRMPTGFDNFSDTAHQDFMALPQEIISNRKLLKETMEKYGFLAFDTEWWHYSMPDPLKYEVLDLSFSQLESLVN